MLKDIKKVFKDKEFRDMFLHGLAGRLRDAAEEPVEVAIIVGVGFLLVYTIVSLTF